MGCLELWISLAIAACILIYILTGGVDFGVGILSLFPPKDEKEAYRKDIEKTMSPVWEANHVWLIAAIVLLFVCFSRAFAVLMISLYLPFLLMIIGIIFRGTAFAFQSYGYQDESSTRKWRMAFAWTSIFVPLTMGIVFGTVISGNIRHDITQELMETSQSFLWLSPFPILIGILTVALFAAIAAIFMARETTTEHVIEAYRNRALIFGLMSTVLLLIGLGMGKSQAPSLYAGFTEKSGTGILLILGIHMAFASLESVRRGRFGLGQIFCA